MPLITRNIVPRIDNEGSLGTANKKWNNLHVTDLNISGSLKLSNLTDGTNVGIGIDSLTFNLDTAFNWNAKLSVLQSSSNYSIYGSNISTDLHPSGGICGYVSNTNSISASNNSYGGVFINHPRVLSGITNSGGALGVYIENLRSYNTTTDSGTLTNLVGASICYGNGGGSNPITTNAYGLYVRPIKSGGSIVNMYDIYLGADEGSASVTNRFGIYQVNTGKNYFAGDVGIGKTSSCALDVNGTIKSSSQFISTQANSTGTGEGQIYLNGASGNRIDFSAVGVNIPTYTTRSAGTKIVFYPSITETTVDTAIGMSNNALWTSIGSSIGSFKWYAGTSNIMTLTGTGELGVGTLTPASKLSVLGNLSVGATYANIAAPTSGAIFEGNVGIGTSSPGYQLHLKNTSTDCVLKVEGSASTDAVIQINNGSNYFSWFIPSGGTSLQLYKSIGAASIFCATTNNLFGFLTNSPASTVSVLGNLSVGATYANIVAPTSGAIFEGNVGIGTSNPGKQLHIKGTINGAAIKLENNDSSRTWGVANGYASGTDGKFIIYDYTTPRVGILIDTDGLVGFNTVSPASRVSVAGNLSVGASYAAITAPTNGAIFQGKVGVGSANPDVALYVADSSTTETCVATFQNANSSKTTQIKVMDADSRYFNCGRVSSTSAFIGTADLISFYSGANVVMVMNAGGSLSLGTNESPTTRLDINGDSFRVRNSKTPATATSTGVQGEICWNSTYMYVCVATNTWRRIPHSSW